MQKRVPWHPRLRRNLYVAGECLIRAKGLYYGHYLAYKEALAIKHSGDKMWPQHRLHDVAFWKMTKLFLAHLWVVYSTAEGLKSREPYAVELLGHVKIDVHWEGG